MITNKIFCQSKGSPYSGGGAAEQRKGAEGSDTSDTCSMIAMATHGRGGLVRWAMGSVTERVLAATTLPLLVVRPTDTIVGATFMTPVVSYKEEQNVVIAS